MYYKRGGSMKVLMVVSCKNLVRLTGKYQKSISWEGTLIYCILD